MLHKLLKKKIRWNTSQRFRDC